MRTRQFRKKIFSLSAKVGGHLGDYSRDGNYQPRSQGSLSTLRKYPGYGWSRVCKILADSRDVIEGRGWKVQVCLHGAHLLSRVESRICNPPVMDRQLTAKANTFDVGVQCIHCWAKMLALDLARRFGCIFPVDSWTVFGIYGGEKIWQRTWK